MLLSVPVSDAAPFRDGSGKPAVAAQAGQVVNDIGFLVITEAPPGEAPKYPPATSGEHLSSQFLRTQVQAA
ncbi:MAG: hypothetical protein JWP04_2698 [Belnapia sp.]|nr:hypothetical protein [Belnapia sp.]